MSIYQSTKAAPYVYLCTHKITGEFYFGYREVNLRLNIPSSQDLPKYKTSSKKVKPIFAEFNWIILAEFFSGNDAYDFEQLLIHENWNNPLLLNQNCQYNTKRFKSTIGRKLSLATRTKMSVSKKGKNTGPTNPMFGKTGEASPNFGKQVSEETRQKISDSNLGKPGLAGEKNPMYGKLGVLNPRYGIPRTDEVKQKIRNANLGNPGLSGKDNPMFGRKWSEEHKKMLSKKSIAAIALQGDNHIGTKKLKENVVKMMLDGTHPTMRETVCEHCSRSIKGMSNYSQWHGDNCQSLPCNQKPLIIKRTHCEHCGTAATGSNYIRWHGDNCRNK